jgi:hypothetical protein
MARIIKLTESDLEKIVKKVLIEQRAVPTTSRGQKGEDTKKIQQALKYKGYKLGTTGPNNDGVDGDFGPATQRAIKDFQTKRKLKPTGSVDQLTRNELFTGFANSQFLSTLPGYTDLTKTTAAKPATKAVTKTTTKAVAKTVAKNETGFILIWAFPEYEPKVDGQGKMAQFFGSLIRVTSGGGGREGTYGKLGHGGCVVIKPNGNATCYEFGRYPGAKQGYGKVLSHPLGNIAKIKNGVLTNPEQVAIAARKKTFPPGPTMDMSVAVVKLPNPSGAEKYASVKERQYSAADFSIKDEDANCGTFARDVAYAGGINMGTFCFPTPNAVVNSFKDRADKMFKV